MSEYIDERIVSIKFDNSGFAEGVSETQKQLDSLNKSLEFDGANEGAKELTKAFKDVSNEAKKTDLSPIRNAVENISDKFSALGGIATGVLFKIGSDAVDAGKRLIKSISIDPIAKGFDKYQQILSAQMTMIASLGGETEEEVKRNKEQIEDSMKILTWYADETSASLQDMLSNLSSFSKYGIDLDVATDAIMGIANAGFKAGIAIPQITHALEGFSKSIGQGFVSYQTWKTWIHSSGIDTVEFKNTFIDAAKQMLKEGAELGDGVRLLGDQLQYYAGKNEGWINVTAEAMENSLTKGKWLTNDVLMNGLTRYNAAMRDVYELTEQGARSVADLTDEEKALVDQTSLAAFLFGQQSKTLTEVTDAMQDAITTAWATIFKSLIGDYEQTVQIWSDMAEYVWEFFVIPLQNVSDMLEEFGKSTSNIFDETTGKFLTMREVIVGSIMNIFEAIKSVIDPIKEAFEVVFRPFETVPEKLQNGVESFYNFTKSLILTRDEAEKLRNKFIAVFNVLKIIGEVVKTVIDLVKKYVWPIIKKVASFAIKIIKVIGTALIKLISTISSFVSRVFGVRDIVADIKEDILSAAEAIDEMSESADDGYDSLDNFKSKLSDSDDSMKKYASDLSDVTDAMDDLTKAEEKNSKSSSKKEKDYTIPGGYDGTIYLSYYQAIEKANNKTLAEFIKEKGITEKQYEKVIEMLKKKDEGEAIYLSDMANASGLSISTMSELSKIIDQTTVAYDKSDKAISDILNKDAEAKKWETIWDGINEAQKATLITYGDEQAALQLYFKQGIKDYSEIAKMIGLEEWKVRRVISAYEEAYAVEELLAKQKKEVNADNIDAARQELGYITRKTEEKKKEQKLTERDKSIAERNARIQERNERLGIKTNRTTSNSVSVIGNAIRQIPIIGTAFDALTNVFGKTSKATTKSSESINKSIHSVRDYIDEISDNDFITSKDNFYEVKESADDTAKSIDEIAESGSKAETALKTSTAKMSDYFKKLNKNATDASTSIEQSNEKITPSSKSGSKNTSGVGSLAEEVGKIFGDKSKGGNGKIDNTGVNTIEDNFDEIIERIKEAFINGFTYIKDKAVAKFTEIRDKAFSKLSELKNKSIKDIFDPIISKIKEIWPVISTTFSNISADLEGFFKAPAQTIGKVIEDIKNGFKSLFSKEDAEAGMGTSAFEKLGEESKNVFLASIDDMLNETWKKIKEFFKNKADEARNDSDNPFHGLVHMFDNIIDWWDDFSYDINKYFGRIKEAIHVVFGPGTLFDKLSSGSLWRPFIDLVVNTIDKFDALRINISKLKDSLTTGFKEAFNSLDTDAKTVFDNISNKIESISNYAKDFWTKVTNAKEVISGGGGGAGESSEENTNGLIGLIAKISLKWDEFKNKLKEGLSWDSIIKIQELESILERLIKAIANAWIKIGLAKMAMDIGKFFSGIGQGIENLSEPLKKNKDLGKTLLEIAFAVAILAASFYSLGQMKSKNIEKASKAIKTLSAVLGTLFSVVSGFTRVFQMNTKFGKATSIPQALGNGLESLFGQKNTMSQAAKLILGIGAGIYLISEAFSVLIDATKDITEDQWKTAIKTLVIIAGIVVIALLAIAAFIGKFGKGKGGLAIGGIDIENKTIQKTISPVAETLKGFAVALGVLIAGFAIISATIDKYMTNKDGSMMKGKFAAVSILLAAMVAALALLMWETTALAKRLQGFDPKVLKTFENIMKPFIMGMATLIYGFQTLTKTIDNLKKPKTFKHATILLFGMIVAVGILMLVVVALAKWITGESSTNIDGMAKSLDVGGDGALGGMSGFVGYFSKSKTKSSKGDVSDAIKKISEIAISLGFGIKLLASAFSTIVTAIDGIKTDGTFGRAIGTFIAMILAMAVLVGEVGFIAAKIPLGASELFKSVALFMVSIGASVLLMAKGVAELSEAFYKIMKNGEKGTAAVDKALTVIGVFLGGIAALFLILSLVSATGVGGVAVGIASAALVAMATAILEIAAAVYVFAKGLEILVNVIIKAASANKELSKGLDNLIKIMPKVKKLVIETMKAIVAGLIEGLMAAQADIAEFLVKTLDSLLTTLAKYLPKIADKLDDIKEPLNKICDWIENFIRERFHSFVTTAHTMRADAQKLFTDIIRLLISSIGNGIVEGATDIATHIIMAIRIILNVWRTELPSILEDLSVILHAIRAFIIWEIDDFLKYCATKATTWANGITNIIVAIINGIKDSRSTIITAIEGALLSWADDIVSLFKTRGSVLAKLLTIPAAIIQGMISEFKNLISGGNLFEQIFGDDSEGNSIEEKTGNMWNKIKTIFTDKNHADINEEKQISEAAKKWGIYIANGIADGLNTVPNDLQSNADSLLKEIIKAYNTASGLNEDGSANASGKVYKLGEYTAKGILKGLKDFATNEETKKAAEALWKEINKQFRKSAKISSPSKESYKWGEYIGMGLTNGLEKSSQDVGQAAVNMWETFYEPMEENIESFSAVTSSMLSQLLDANMDINPVITPVFDMSNLDAASSSMSAFFDAQDALEVAGSFNGMQKSRMELENNQNEGDSTASSGPTYNYVQNNYSPKALSAIEIYRKTKNQLNFRTYAGG